MSHTHVKIASDAPIVITRKKARELTAQELRECYALVKKIKPLYEAAGDEWDRRDKIAEMSTTPNLEYFLCSHLNPPSKKKSSSKKILAYLSAVLDDVDDHGSPTTFVYEIHVDPAVHGQGIGRRLIDTVLKKSPAHKITLRTFECNKPARKFYHRLGFTKDESISTPKIFFMELDAATLTAGGKAESNEHSDEDRNIARKRKLTLD